MRSDQEILQLNLLQQYWEMQLATPADFTCPEGRCHFVCCRRNASLCMYLFNMLHCGMADLKECSMYRTLLESQGYLWISKNCILGSNTQLFETSKEFADLKNGNFQRWWCIFQPFYCTFMFAIWFVVRDEWCIRFW